MALSSRCIGFAKLLALGLCLLMVWGCTSVRPHGPAAVPLASTSVDLTATGRVQAKLQAQHKEWAGTRYRLGGLSKSGVDCSGFVYLTFREKLGLVVPRTTSEQVNTGRAIALSALRPGDLVFFRTGFKARHVGIYMGDHRFMHASTSQGVTISSLNNPYWRGAYWQARRLAH